MATIAELKKLINEGRLREANLVAAIGRLYRERERQREALDLLTEDDPRKAKIEQDLAAVDKEYTEHEGVLELLRTTIEDLEAKLKELEASSGTTDAGNSKKK